jgi:hypothetical protein
MRPFLGKTQRDGTAYAGGSASDQDDFISKSHGATLFSPDYKELC